VLGSALTLPATPTRSGLCLLVALRRLSWSGSYSVQEPNREGLASCAADSAEPAPSANFVNSVLTDCCAARNIRATTHNATSPHALPPPPPPLPPPPLRPLACVHDEAAGRLKNGAARRVNNSLFHYGESPLLFIDTCTVAVFVRLLMPPVLLPFMLLLPTQLPLLPLYLVLLLLLLVVVMVAVHPLVYALHARNLDTDETARNAPCIRARIQRLILNSKRSVVQ
jgi:hypothetical protein